MFPDFNNLRHSDFLIINARATRHMHRQNCCLPEFGPATVALMVGKETKILVTACFKDEAHLVSLFIAI